VSGDRIAVRYRLTLVEGEAAEAKARDIALEQTVELPDGCYPPEVGERVVGRVETVRELEDGEWEALITYDPSIVGDAFLSLLNLLFGNISMKCGIRVTALDLPPPLLARFKGPSFGVAGVRGILGVEDGRPLVCAAAKPVGLSARQLAAVCTQFAEAGVDIIKDDHSLANQEWAPFEERVARCQEAVDRANERTGGKARYFPNLLGSADQIAAQAETARAAGCVGVVVGPLLVGLDVMRALARESGLAIFAHPALSGVFFGPGHGVAPEVLYGTIFRLAGADAAIYPNAGGRFPMSEDTCLAINDHLRRPLGGLEPAFPVAGGGVDAARVPYWIERYGTDMIFLIGSSFYARPDLGAACREVVNAARRYAHE
jgi:ribulose-bisphosphate carboxylase large chain